MPEVIASTAAVTWGGGTKVMLLTLHPSVQCLLYLWHARQLPYVLQHDVQVWSWNVIKQMWSMWCSDDGISISPKQNSLRNDAATVKVAAEIRQSGVGEGSQV